MGCVPNKSINSTYQPLSYTYDPTGNILSKTTGSSTMTYRYENPAHVHAVSSIIANGNTYNFVYDANGNMTSGWDLTDLANVASRQIEYNADNKPFRITYRSNVSTFVYDGNGGRAKKVSPSGTTYYVGRHYEVTNGVSVKYIFAGSERVAKVSNAGTFYFHGDHLGSAAAMTDELGNVVETSNYQPFGSMRVHTGSTVSNFKFTGQEFDPETGLYYYGARYYDPTIGRFLSPDTIVPNFRNPQSLNRYSYVDNNPLIYTDPTGHFKVGKLFKKVIGAIVGIAVTVLTGGGTAPLLPGIWPAIAGGVVGGVVSAAVNGGNILEGALFGALSGFVGGTAFNLAGNTLYGVTDTITKGMVHAIAGAAAGSVTTALYGGDIGIGMLTGFVSGAVSSAVGSALEGQSPTEKLLARMASGAVAGGATAAIAGGDIALGMVSGAIVGMAEHMFNEMCHNYKVIGARNGNVLVRNEDTGLVTFGYPSEQTDSAGEKRLLTAVAEEQAKIGTEHFAGRFGKFVLGVARVVNFALNVFDPFPNKANAPMSRRDVCRH